VDVGTLPNHLKSFVFFSLTLLYFFIYISALCFLICVLGVDLGERLGNSVDATSGVALHLFGGLGNLSFQVICRVPRLFFLVSHFHFRLYMCRCVMCVKMKLCRCC
jgi:hypothetical protein